MFAYGGKLAEHECSSSPSVGSARRTQLVLCGSNCRVVRELSAGGERLSERPLPEDVPGRFEVAVQVFLLGDCAWGRMQLA